MKKPADHTEANHAAMRRGGEAKGNLSWNFDFVFRHNTGRGLRVLWDKGKITML